MPLGRDVGTNIEELRAHHPDWPRRRILAAALSGARAAGNRSIKPYPKGRSRRRKRRIAWRR